MVQVLKGYKKELTSQDSQVSHRMQALMADAQSYGVPVAGFINEDTLHDLVRQAKARQFAGPRFVVLSL